MDIGQAQNHSAQASWPDERPLLEMWTETLRQEITDYRRRKRLRALRWILIPLLFLVLWRIFHVNVAFWWMWFGMGANAAADATAESRRELATSLTNTQDPRVVSVLALAARDGDDDTRRISSRGLERILPALKASDRRHISDEGMSALLALPRSGRLPLTLAVLEALKQIGDSRGIPMVEELARGPRGASPDGQTERLQEAAKECLPYLRRRVEEEAARATLLRAAGDMGAQETLLRPTLGAGDSEKENLLRPTDSGAQSAG